VSARCRVHPYHHDVNTVRFFHWPFLALCTMVVRLLKSRFGELLYISMYITQVPFWQIIFFSYVYISVSISSFQVPEPSPQTYEKLLTNKTEHIFTDSWFVLSLSSFSVCLYRYATCASERSCVIPGSLWFFLALRKVFSNLLRPLSVETLSLGKITSAANVIVMPRRDQALPSAGRGRRNEVSLSICFPFPGNRQQNPEYQSGSSSNRSTCYQPLVRALSHLQLFPSDLDNESWGEQN